jgi:hypothetical protein
MSDELRIDTALPDTARDQLRVLAAEVDDEDRAVVALRQRDDVGAMKSGNSAPPW